MTSLDELQMSFLLCNAPKFPLRRHNRISKSEKVYEDGVFRYKDIL